jgi:hypothetical protein
MTGRERRATLRSYVTYFSLAFRHSSFQWSIRSGLNRRTSVSFPLAAAFSRRARASLACGAESCVMTTALTTLSIIKVSYCGQLR